MRMCMQNTSNAGEMQQKKGQTLASVFYNNKRASFCIYVRYLYVRMRQHQQQNVTMSVLRERNQEGEKVLQPKNKWYNWVRKC